MSIAENRINYIEIPVVDPQRTRDFLKTLFGWSFQDWGDDYISFNDGNLDGGLRRTGAPAPAGGVLVVLYSTDLDRDLGRVVELGATISQDVFAFPGGWRFHFREPSGTEFAIWSDAEPGNRK